MGFADSQLANREPTDGEGAYRKCTDRQGTQGVGTYSGAPDCELPKSFSVGHDDRFIVVAVRRLAGVYGFISTGGNRRG